MQASTQIDSKEIRDNLVREFECLFLDEWGGPRSELAICFLRQNVIPQLVNCIVINHQYLENNTFIDILANKLNTEFAYPPTFAEGLSQDIVRVSIKVLGKHCDPQSHPWKPWEDITRMITVGFSIKDIVDKTAFAEAYIETFRKRYLNFSGLAERFNGDFGFYAQLPDLNGYGNQLLRFMVDFRSRFKVFKNYYARLQAEQVIYDYALPLNVDELLQLLEAMYHVDNHYDKQNLTSHFGGVLSNKKDSQIKIIIDKLIQNHLLVQVSGNDQKLGLSPKAAMLIVPILSPQLAQEILDLLHSRVRDRISRSTALLIGKNNEVVVHVIKQLVKQNDPIAIMFFKALYRKATKPVLLEILSACAEFKNGDIVGLITKALQHRDSMVRLRACQAIEKLADKSYYFYLIATLQDSVPMVREQAVKALSSLNMPSVIRHLESMLDNEENINLRSLIKETISKIKEQQD